MADYEIASNLVLRLSFNNPDDLDHVAGATMNAVAGSPVRHSCRELSEVGAVFGE